MIAHDKLAIDALAKLGDLTEFTDTDTESLEKFAILIYCKAIPFTVKNLTDLKLHFFSKQSSNLCVVCSCYTTLQCKSWHISASILTDPLDLG